MTSKSFPTIQIGPRGPSDEGKLLHLPEEYGPPGETHSPEAIRATHRVAEFLREEEQRAADAGMTVEELRYYQELLQKKF